MRPPGRRPRVVIADDHPSVLTAFVRMLELSCDIVASVPNGQEAVDAAARSKPDVLVVDLLMPDLDGLEICRRVRERSPDTAVVIVTAFDDANVRDVAVREGATAFVAKHAAAETLELTIQRVFTGRHGIPAAEDGREGEPRP